MYDAYSSPTISTVASEDRKRVDSKKRREARSVCVCVQAGLRCESLACHPIVPPLPACLSPQNDVQNSQGGNLSESPAAVTGPESQSIVKSCSWKDSRGKAR